MKKYGKSRTTTAPPERVWSVWSDPDNWSRWNSGIRSAQIDGSLASGTTGVMVTMRGSKHDVVFSGVEAPKGFAMSMKGPPLTTITFLCEIAPNGSGSTIAQSAVFSGALAFLFGPMIGPQMAPHFEPVLDDLARTAETPT